MKLVIDFFRYVLVLTALVRIAVEAFRSLWRKVPEPEAPPAPPSRLPPSVIIREVTYLPVPRVFEPSEPLWRPWGHTDSTSNPFPQNWTWGSSGDSVTWSCT